MQQLIETPGVQITMIPVTIPLPTTEHTMVVGTDLKEHDTKEVTVTSRLAMSAAKGVAVESSGVTTDTLATLQGQLWKEGQEESVRVVELELDQGGESQNESQVEEEDVQDKRDGGETTSKSSEEEEEEQRKEDERSTLTSESESDEELTSQPSKKLKPIPVLFNAPLSTKDVTPSADFNLDDPLGMKAMKAALQNLTGSKGPKGPGKQKATKRRANCGKKGKRNP